ncbi:DUF4157 domain-containing protein [Halobaculum sp. MBLA0147]|uniref:eCIS core domain-containing protein n=1 Tax=Halobaculum sp. MBLA0147 TaxID=3079934 RepID=UPI0035257879
MGRRSRRSRGRTPEADGEQSSETEGDDDVQRWPSDSAVGPNTAGPATKEEVEAYYGCEVSSAKEYKELQRLEKAYGGQVLRWADEGIPLDAMGDQSKIQRFRERRDSEIPYDIEEFNKDSLDENTGRVARRVRESPDGKTDVPDSVREVISSPGRPLDTSIQRAVEERMGDSLGDVRIHTGPKAAAAADQINARAFTVGNHVAFGAGEYDPESAEGQHVLAHELAHVRQQTGGDLSMLPEEDVQLEIDPDPELEREAEETAQRVMSGGKLGIQKLSDSEVHVQRALDRFNPLSGSSESESSDSTSVDELARRLEVVEQNQAALFESMAGDGAESGDVNLEALVEGDQKGALEKVGEAGTYGALGELVKAGGTEALKQGAVVGGLATAGSVGLPVALAAGVVAATAAGGTVAATKNRGSIADWIKSLVESDDERNPTGNQLGSGSQGVGGSRGDR